MKTENYFHSELENTLNIVIKRREIKCNCKSLFKSKNKQKGKRKIYHYQASDIFPPSQFSSFLSLSLCFRIEIYKPRNYGSEGSRYFRVIAIP